MVSSDCVCDRRCNSLVRFEFIRGSDFFPRRYNVFFRDSFIGVMYMGPLCVFVPAGSDTELYLDRSTTRISLVEHFLLNC